LIYVPTAQAVEAAVQLRRVGLDRVVGHLDGGMYEWAKAGLPTEHVCQISAEKLHQRIQEGPELTLLDVRAKGEFVTGHINGAVHIPFPDLRTRYRELNPNVPTLVICNTGHRSSLATSLLKRYGFKEVWNVAGGMTGYNAAGFGPECSVCIAPHLPRIEKTV
jgi:hydroxyacylglutathione hydrolase